VDIHGKISLIPIFSLLTFQFRYYRFTNTAASAQHSNSRRHILGHVKNI